MTTAAKPYTKPTITKKPVPLTRREAQLIDRLRQLANGGARRAEVELTAEDGPRVRELRGIVPE